MAPTWLISAGTHESDDGTEVIKILTGNGSFHHVRYLVYFTYSHVVAIFYRYIVCRQKFGLFHTVFKGMVACYQEYNWRIIFTFNGMTIPTDDFTRCVAVTIYITV